MTVKRVNSTGRQKIMRADARFFLSTDGDGITVFDAALELADYELPNDALVFVEAYRQTTFMRFGCGTVAEISLPTVRRLTEFATPDGLLFRVKVTATGERPGVLLAEADQIPISEHEDQPDDRIPLFAYVPAPLGQELWRIDFTGPRLLLFINDRIGIWKDFAQSWSFRSLALTAAVREVLTRILLIESDYEYDPSDPDLESWQGHWLHFAHGLVSDALPPNDAGTQLKLDWIESVLECFTRRSEFFDQLRPTLEREGWL